MKGNNKKKRRNGDKKMAILTAECDRMFSVAEDQINLFKKIEGNKKSREKAEVIVSKISKKIIVEGNTSSNDNA